MNIMEETATVSKGGILRIQFLIRRMGPGLMIRTKVHPEVEEFMRTLGSGETVDVGTIGRWWEVGKDQAPLTAYTSQRLELTRAEDGHYFTLDKLGQPLILGTAEKDDTTNLSLLRLVGASEGSGVAFTIRGVQTLEAARRLRDRLQLAGKAFYINYVRPVNLEVTISTSEVQY